MRRRDFLGVLGGAAVALPPAARAQQAARPRRIGVLSPLAADHTESRAASRRFCKRCSNWARPTAATCGSNTTPARTPSRCAGTRPN